MTCRIDGTMVIKAKTRDSRGFAHQLIPGSLWLIHVDDNDSYF